MTGRYNYRTGVIDTFAGRSMMHPDEVTLAQMFAPGRLSLRHLRQVAPGRQLSAAAHRPRFPRGAGASRRRARQPGNRPGGDGYFDPILEKNGQPERVKGYCSDIFTDAAIAFIEANRDRPWLAYLAYNAPHTPLELPDILSALPGDEPG